MDVIMMERLSQESTQEFVYRFLKVNIMDLKFPPGSALSEKDISGWLNVSRTPVREAFIRLSQEYLLDVIPQKGTYVSLIDLDSVQESKFMREILEKEVVKIACTDFPSEKLFELQSYFTLQELCLQEKNYMKFFELDEDLHGTIFAGCKKKRIWSMIQQMNTHYNRVRMMNIAGGYDLWRILEQHRELIRAIKEKDVALGMRIIDVHLNKIRIDLEDLLRDYAHYFKQTEFSEAVKELNGTSH